MNLQSYLFLIILKGERLVCLIYLNCEANDYVCALLRYPVKKNMKESLLEDCIRFYFVLPSYLFLLCYTQKCLIIVF